MGVRALGLDLSLTSSGLVVVEGEGYTVKEWRNPKTDSKKLIEERIDIIARQAMILFKKWKPDIVMMESGARGGKFVDLNIYHLAGVVRWKMWKREAPICFISPTGLKKEATGNGRAQKPAMLAAARIFWPDCVNHDLADGFHLARYAIDNYSTLVSLA